MPDAGSRKQKTKNNINNRKPTAPTHHIILYLSLAEASLDAIHAERVRANLPRFSECFIAPVNVAPVPTQSAVDLVPICDTPHERLDIGYWILDIGYCIRIRYRTIIDSDASHDRILQDIEQESISMHQNDN